MTVRAGRVFSRAMPNPENLMPPGGGIERGAPLGSPAHPICTARRKDGQPCRMVAMGGTGKCYWHGGDKSPERKARSLALGAAKGALAQARERLGGTLPPDLVQSPAWRRIPGDTVATYQRYADLALAYAERDRDGGRAWRQAVARHAKDD